MTYLIGTGAAIAIGVAVGLVLVLALLAIPLIPSGRRYLRMKRM